MITMKDIAREAKVSTATVSYVLNNKSGQVLSRDVSERVKLTAKKLGYRRNELARSMATGKYDVIAVVVLSNINVEFTQKIIFGAVDAALDRNFMVKLFQAGKVEMKSLLETLMSYRIRGVFLQGETISMLEPWLEELSKRSIFSGVLGIPNYTGMGMGVYTNDVNGTVNAVDYLYSIGHTRIAHLTCKDHSMFEYSQFRKKGYLKVVNKYSDIKKRIIEAEFDKFDYNFDKFSKIFKETEKTRPTAFVCSSDYMASELFQVAYKAKKYIPDDLSVIGFGDLDFSSRLSLPLTTVSQPFKKMGYKAMNMLIDGVQKNKKIDGENIILDTELKVRESCRKLN